MPTALGDIDISSLPLESSHGNCLCGIEVGGGIGGRVWVCVHVSHSASVLFEKVVVYDSHSEFVPTETAGSHIMCTKFQNANVYKPNSKKVGTLFKT